MQSNEILNRLDLIATQSDPEVAEERKELRKQLGNAIYEEKINLIQSRGITVEMYRVERHPEGHITQRFVPALFAGKED